MVNLIRYRVNWAGQSGGAGFSTLHIRTDDATPPTATDVTNAQSRVRLFFENTSEWIPNDVTISFPQSQDVIEVTTQQLVSVVSATASAANVPGALTGNWQNGVGTRVVWQTGIVSNGRRIKGYTYLVPYGSIFDVDGTLNAAALTDLQTNATALLSGLVTDGLKLVVNSAKNFSAADVASATFTDKPVILRSRRD